MREPPAAAAAASGTVDVEAPWEEAAAGAAAAAGAGAAAGAAGAAAALIEDDPFAELAAAQVAGQQAQQAQRGSPACLEAAGAPDAAGSSLANGGGSLSGPTPCAACGDTGARRQEGAKCGGSGGSRGESEGEEEELGELALRKLRAMSKALQQLVEALAIESAQGGCRGWGPALRALPRACCQPLISLLDGVQSQECCLHHARGPATEDGAGGDSASLPPLPPPLLMLLLPALCRWCRAGQWRGGAAADHGSPACHLWRGVALEQAAAPARGGAAARPGL